MKSQKWWAAIGVAIAAGGIGIGYAAYAQTGTDGLQPPHLIPYQGYLEDAQGPVNTTGTPLDVTFFITTGPTDAYTESCGEASGCIWKETDQLVVANGYFSTVLGDETSLAGKFGGSDRYLGIRVGTVTLEGRQRLLASPYAITAATAQDFTVAGTLTAQNVSASSAVTFGRLNGFVKSSQYSVNQNSTTSVQMTPSADSICFLTGYSAVAQSGEVAASCLITTSGSNWVLQPNTSGISGGVFSCQARCLRWD